MFMFNVVGVFLFSYCRNSLFVLLNKKDIISKSAKNMYKTIRKGCVNLRIFVRSLQQQFQKKIISFFLLFEKCLYSLFNYFGQILQKLQVLTFL